MCISNKLIIEYQKINKYCRFYYLARQCEKLTKIFSNGNPSEYEEENKIIINRIKIGYTRFND